MKNVHPIMASILASIAPKNDNCPHGNDSRYCLTCEKQELRRQEAREEMDRYHREKYGE